jgi:hypothetical protein
MTYTEALYYETLDMNEKIIVILESLNNINQKTPINQKVLEYVEKEAEKLKDKEKATGLFLKFKEYCETNEQLKTVKDSFLFDLFIMRTFGFGITSLINPVMIFLNTFKISISVSEIALLIIAILFSISEKIPLNRNEFIKKLKNTKLKNIFSFFKKGVDKFLEFLAYTSMAIPTGGAMLDTFNGNPANWKTVGLGIAGGAIAHGIRALLNRKKK